MPTPKPTLRSRRQPPPIAWVLAWLIPASILAHDPPPRFARAVMLETTAETSANIIIGDLDGDGHLDIVLAKGRHWPLADKVLLGDGHGRFPIIHDLGAASDRSYSARLADLDGDADLDVVLSNDKPDPKLTYLNDGHGRFQVGSTFGRPEWATRNATVADLDGDGRPDIIVANRSSRGASTNYICLNRGRGRFDPDGIAFSHESSTTIAATDLNHDGLPDLIVPHRDGGQSYVYVQQTSAPFPNFRRLPFGPPDAAIRMAEAADLDGDGRLDLIAIDEVRGLTVHFGQPGETFSPGQAIGERAATLNALALGDLNLDGNTDIVVGCVEAPSRLHLNDDSGRHFTEVEFGDRQGTAYGIAIGDLNEDGRPDLAVARSGAPCALYLAEPPESPGRPD